MATKFVPTLLLISSIQGPVHSAICQKCLNCAQGNTACGNFNEGPSGGYKTLGGGICGGDPYQVPAPLGPGLNYSAFWCGSYYIGAIDAKWSKLKPVWQWEEGESKACTSDTRTQYKCTSRLEALEDQCDCVLTGSFQCQDFNVGYLGENWPRECFPVVQATEDTWVRTKFNFKQENAVPSRPPVRYDGLDTIQVSISVQWGWLNLFDSVWRCHTPACRNGTFANPSCSGTFLVEGDIFGHTKDATDCETTCAGLSDNCKVESIRYGYKAKTSSSPPRRTLTFQGNYDAVYLALQNLTYRPDPYQNSLRLKSRYYSPIQAQLGPYEKLIARIYIGTDLVASLTTMVIIDHINNTPTLTNPQDGYKPPPVCEVDPLTTVPACHYGQFYRMENTDKILSIPNVQAADIDIFESCNFAVPECSKVDINVITLRGTTILNSKVGLNLYQNARSALGFSGFLSACNAALLVLGYSVETTVLLGTARSTVRIFNTQHSGYFERITVSVSDQGNTGSTGVAETNFTRVNVTVVAVNNAPMISMRFSEYALTEDTLQSLSGISVSDVDVDEKIESTLAALDWLNKPEYRVFINAISVDLEVDKGRLYLGYTANLRLLYTQEISAITVKAWMSTDPTADFCRLKDVDYEAENGGQVLELTPLGLGTDALSVRLPSGKTVAYRDVCPYVNIGSDDCRLGTEPKCRCYLFENCESTNDYILPFNRSRPGYEEVQVATAALVATLDRTCGGIPFQRWPNKFSYGLPCPTCESGTPCVECGPEVLPKCTPYSADPLQASRQVSNGTCRCCGDLNRACSSNADCTGIPNSCPGYTITTLCGCVEGAPNLFEKAPGKCGPYSFQPSLDLAQGDPNYKRLRSPCEITASRPCTYAGADSRLCRSAMYAYNGTDQTLIVDQLNIGRTGSKQVSMSGPVVDINRLLDRLSYQPDLYYNRRYRLPPEKRDQEYKIESDDLERLRVVVTDNGNSGGGLRDPQTSQASVALRVAAVNNNPEIDAPLEVRVTEDVLFRFERANLVLATCPDPNERQAFSGTLKYRCLPVQIADPDYLDYEFDTTLFKLNISAQYGRVFFNETFLEEAFYRSSPTPDRTGCVSCNRPQDLATCCSCSPSLPGCSLNFIRDGVDTTGLYAFPTPQFGVGNKRILVIGSFTDLNLALSGLAYQGAANFNTRYGRSESLTITVTDHKLIATEPSWQKASVDFVISVVVESVNDPPILGRWIQETRYSAGIAIVSNRLWPISTDQNIADGCLTRSVTDAVYRDRCKVFPIDCPTVQCINETIYRQYIDIDEDTVFVLDSSVLWVDDVDSEEAVTIYNLAPNRQRYCCIGDGVLPEFQRRGCLCGQKPCICGNVSCPCQQDLNVCRSAESGVYPGQLIMEISAEIGRLSWYPPPGRPIMSDITFLALVPGAGASLEQCLKRPDIRVSGFRSCATPCANQLVCPRNASRLIVRGRTKMLQDGISRGFLSYLGAQDAFGLDMVRVWVSDQGFTDECYSDLTAWASGVVQVIPVRVVGVNDNPVISTPRGSTGLLDYSSGARCVYDLFDPPQDGKNCLNLSRVPPDGLPLSVRDVDIDAGKTNNVTMMLTVGRSQAGRFQLGAIAQGMSYLQSVDDEGRVSMLISGTLPGLNQALQTLFFDPGKRFLGYCPFILTVWDNGNWGECSGEHECGHSAPCGNYRTATPHVPDVVRSAKKVLDSVILSSSRCNVDCTGLGPDECCQACNREDGCFYCASSCQGNGKCMEGTAAAPYFETCLPNRVDGRVYGQCTPLVVDWTIVSVAVVVAAVVLGIFIFFFRRWVKRRHENVTKYLRKKLDDFSRMLNRLSLMPPLRDARFFEFLIVLAIVVMLALFFDGTFGISSISPCDFTSQFYLDRATFIDLSLDHCDVRFIPASNFRFPTSAISAVEVRVAYTQGDPLITLSAETCSQTAAITLANFRSDAAMFTGFYCNIELIIPDRAVIPAVRIRATGVNATSVRAGPMDPDTPNFGLDFGPNALTLTGNRLNARLQNLTTKRFEFSADHGSLLAVDLGALGAIPEAEFATVDADLVVTTTRRTSVRYWQKANNRVCLTAANNSAYLSSSCATTCQYLPPDTPKPIPVYLKNAAFCPLIERYPCPRCPVNKLSTVPGCVDHVTCAANDTALCRCKPSCEMVDLSSLSAPSALDGATIVPIAAYCEVGGRCCRTFCYGYSSADLFPTPDQPQCGRCIDPLTMPWGPGELDQRWVFTSETGQISLSVLDSPEVPSASSYAGAAPGSKLPTPELREEDKAALDRAFHSEGGPAPVASYFTLSVTGPGAPERTQAGELVWVRQLWMVVLPQWFLNVLFSGLLEPLRDEGRASLSPGFCPAHVQPGTAEANKRLVTLQTLFAEALQRYPPGAPQRVFPPGSRIVYRSVQGQSSIFVFDPISSAVAISPIVPQSYYTLILITAIGLLVPLLLSAAFTLGVTVAYRRKLRQFRRNKIELEKNIVNISREMRMLLDNTPPNIIASTMADYMHISDEEMRRTREQTPFFAFVAAFTFQEEQYTFLARFFIAIQNLVISTCPSWFLLKVAGDLRVYYNADACAMRIDTCACNDSPVTASTAVGALAYTQMLCAVCELSAFYLVLPYRSVAYAPVTIALGAYRISAFIPSFSIWVVVRHVFYLSSFLVGWVGVFTLLAAGTWVFIGFIIDPVQLAPLLLALASVILAGARHARHLRRQRQDARALLKVTAADKESQLRRGVGRIPQTGLDAILTSKIEKELNRFSLSWAKIVASTAIFVGLLTVLLGFLYIGFVAFSDTRDPLSAVVNCHIVLAAAACFSQVARGKAGKDDDEVRLKEIRESVDKELQNIFDCFELQLQTATRMVEELERSRAKSAQRYHEEHDDA